MSIPYLKWPTCNIVRVSSRQKVCCSVAKPGRSGNGRRVTNAQVQQRLNDIVNAVDALSRKVEGLIDKISPITAEQIASIVPTLRTLEDANVGGPKTLQELIADAVSETVVGESYTRWDSTSTYFPTLVFLFVEEGSSSSYRRGQIKLRAPVSNEALKVELIEEYKSKIELIRGVNYIHGSTRCNYVSQDKRFKTTIFCTSIEDAKATFASLFSVIGESFDESNMSITTGRRRTNSTRRLKPLGETVLNENRYSEEFPLHLRKVVLLVNGLRAPILLYKK